MSKFNQQVEIFSGEITKMEIQKKRKDRINLFLNQVYAFSCHIDLIFEFKLDRGRQLTPEDSKALLVADDEKMAYQYGLKLALMRSVSVADCRKKLMSYEFMTSSINQAIEKLIENQFLDDLRFAQNFYEMKRNLYGRYRIQQELKRHGVSAEVIGRVTEALADSEQELDDAIRYAAKKYDGTTKMDQKTYARIYGFLSRKGFSADIIRKVMDHIKTQSQYENEENNNPFEEF